MTEPVIGIDLGTTNSVASIFEYGETALIPNSEGDFLTPSVVYVRDLDTVVVGKPAKNQKILEPDNVISSVKRYMGTDKTYEIAGKNYTPEEISSFILAKLKADTEKKIGKPVKKAIITVPAYFNDNQRKATIEAGSMAGLEVVRIINEPTASSLAYGFGKDIEERTVIVYDLGGGTFDVSLLDIGNGVFNVVATSGDNMLGGIDFDRLIVQELLENFKKKNGIDLGLDKFALAKLFDEAEKAKIALSEHDSHFIQIPFISANERGPIHLDNELTRVHFEDLIAHYVDYTVKHLQNVLSDANLQPSDIDAVILVGGSTKIPLVQRRIEELFPGKTARDINPEEVVARGAAIQAAIVEGIVDDLLLVDVTPLSLGLEVVGGLFIPLIDRNTQVPCENSKIFTTVADNQKVVEINVFQGERKKCRENFHLGKFLLKDIRQIKAGAPKIRVTFALDVNGMLKVTALDEDSKSVQTVVFDSQQSKLKVDDIRKIVRMSRDFEKDDMEFEELLRVKNRARMLRDRLRDKLDSGNVKYELTDEIRILLGEIDRDIDTGYRDKLDNYLETLTYYMDELDYQQSVIISNELLKG